ncbi:hypothetical protein AVEN_75068-1 [Araneus ventricosus]|uniref:Uncharacterized protein n=1 Tax=Araneus ventricosus TaxID=182803 RepID=A0A4Y2RXP0_ARAVE|nr:hypothetical protein AVEN_75068-1 [Araneus ventricosus]
MDLVRVTVEKCLLCRPPISNTTVLRGATLEAALNAISDGFTEHDQKKCRLIMRKFITQHLTVQLLNGGRHDEHLYISTCVFAYAMPHSDIYSVALSAVMGIQVPKIRLHSL